MQDSAIPVTLCQVNWTAYLNDSQELLGHNPARGVDASPSRLSDLAKFTASLAEFKLKEELKPTQTLRTPGPWLRHSFYGFLIHTSGTTILDMAESTDLEVLSTSSLDKGMRAAIVSGTLAQWRDAVIVCCGANSKERTRRLFNLLKGFFDQLGLSEIWSEYTVINLPDKTYALEYRK